MPETAALARPQQLARVEEAEVAEVQPRLAVLPERAQHRSRVRVEEVQAKLGLLAVQHNPGEYPIGPPEHARQVDVVLVSEVHPDRIAAVRRHHPQTHARVRRPREGVAMVLGVELVLPLVDDRIVGDVACIDFHEGDAGAVR